MTRRICTIATIALLGISLSVSAQTGSPSSGTERVPGSPSAVGAASARAPANATLSLLRKRVESVDWLDSPFEVVINWLTDEGENRVNIVPRWNALSIESVDRDTLVSLQLNNTTVAEVLREAFENISPDGEIGYQGVGNKLTISTRTDFDRRMELKVYDVADLLFRVPDFGRSAPNIDLANVGRGGGGGGGGGGGQSPFQGGGSQGQGGSESGQQAEQRMTERLERLRELIEQTIAPDSWDTGNTGGLGTIRPFGTSLIVRNTIEVHEMIGGTFSYGD